MVDEVQNKRFRELVQEITSLHETKCRDYGTVADPIANLREFGLLGVIIRMNDKIVRLKSFARNGQLYVKDESVVDTLKDLATYALLGIQLYEEEKKNKNGVVPSEGLGPTSTIVTTIDFTSPTTTTNQHSQPLQITNTSTKNSLDNYPSLPQEKRKLRLPKL